MRYTNPRLLYFTLLYFPIRQRILFKLAMIVFKCLHGLAQSYQADDCVLASAVVGRRRLRSADTMKLLVRRTIRLSSAPETLQFRPQPFGTVYFKYFYYVAVTPTYCYTLRRASSETWNTTAVFPYQTLWHILRDPNEDIECRWGIQNPDFDQYVALCRKRYKTGP